MPRTIYRQPNIVDTDIDTNIKFHSHSNWKGICDDKNYLNIDQETFEDCKNVYMSSDALLKSRPSFKIKTNTEKITKKWVFGDIIFVLDNEGTLIQKQPGEIVYTLVNPSIFQKEGIIFVFAENGIWYYDDVSKQLQDAKDLLYVPTTITYTNDIKDDNATESENAIYSSKKSHYIYTKRNVSLNNVTADVSIGPDVYKNYNVTSDLNIVAAERSFELTLYSKISVSNRNTGLICYCDLSNLKQPKYTVYYSSDMRILEYKEVVTDSFIPPVISEDGTLMAKITKDGLYFKSLISINNIYEYEDWTKIIDVETWSSSDAALFENENTFNYNDSISLRVKDNDNYVLIFGTEPLLYYPEHKNIPANLVGAPIPMTQNYESKAYNSLKGYVNTTETGLQTFNFSHNSWDISESSSMYNVYRFRKGVNSTDYKYDNSFVDYNFVKDHKEFADVINIYIPLTVEDLSKNLSDHIAVYKIIGVLGSEELTFTATKYSDYQANRIFDFKLFENKCLISTFGSGIGTYETVFSNTSTTRPVKTTKLYNDYGLIYDNNLLTRNSLVIDYLYEVPLLLRTYYAGDEELKYNNDLIAYVNGKIYYGSLDAEHNLDNLYSNYDDTIINIDIYKTGKIEPLLFEHNCELNEEYISKGNNLYISKNVYNEDGNFKLYFPKIANEQFNKPITNLHPVSENQIAIFFDDEIWYVQKTNLGHEYYKSKLQVGLKEGSDVLTSQDGQNIIFSSTRGLVYMSYQELVQSTEQTLTYLSDTIYDRYKEFNSKPVKLFLNDFWLYCYHNDEKVFYIFDVRNNSWWQWEYYYPILNILIINDEPEFIVDAPKNNLMSLNYSVEDYYDDIQVGDVDERQIDWFIRSQKLHLGTLNYTKNIISMIINNVETETTNEQVSFNLSIRNYRTKISDRYSVPQNLLYKVDMLRTYVKRCNSRKVNEFQYTMMYDDENAIQIPLSIHSIIVKYTMSGQVR